MARKYTLKQARLLSGLTALSVAEKLDMHITTIYGYENFQQYPRVDVAKQMADLYGVKFDEIIFFK